MPVYFAAQVTFRNPEKFQEYAEIVIPQMMSHGAEPMFRAPKARDVEGQTTHDLLGVFKFSDMAAFDAWHGSDAYQATHDLRDEGASVVFTVYEGD